VRGIRSALVLTDGEIKLLLKALSLLANRGADAASEVAPLYSKLMVMKKAADRRKIEEQRGD